MAASEPAGRQDRESVRAQLLTLCLIVGLASFAIGIFVPLVPLYGIALGAEPAVIGIIVSAAYVTPLFLAIPVGAAVDRSGSRGPLSMGTLCLAVAPAILVPWGGLPALAIAQITYGVGHLVLVIAAQSFVGSICGATRREHHFGWYTTAISAGQLLGPLVAGVLVDSVGFRAAYIVSASASLAALVATRYLRRAMSSRAQTPQPMDTAQRLIANPGLRLSLVSSSAVLVALVAHQAFLPLHVTQTGHSATAVGLLFSLAAGATMAIRPLTASIVRALGGRPAAFTVCILLVATGVGATGLMQALPALAVVAILVGAGSGLVQTLSMVALVEHVDSLEHGFAFGMRLAANRIVQIIGPIVLGFTVQLVGLPIMFLVVAAAVLGGLSLLAHVFSAGRRVHLG